MRVDASEVRPDSVLRGGSLVDGNDVGSGSVVPTVVTGVRVETNNVVDGPVLAIGLFDEDILVESVVTGGLLGDAKDVGSCPVVTILGGVDPTDVFFDSVVIMVVTMDVNDDAAGFVLTVGLAVDENVAAVDPMGSVDTKEAGFAPVVTTVVSIDAGDVESGSKMPVVVAGVRVEANNVVDGPVLTIGLLDEEATDESVVTTVVDDVAVLRGGLVVATKDVESCPVVTKSGVVNPTDVFVDSVVKTGVDDPALREGFVEEANKVVAGWVLMMALLVDEDDVGIRDVVSTVVWTKAAVVSTDSIVVVVMSVIAEDV